MIRLTYTSIAPYFLLMALFWLEAAVIQRHVPFFRRALTQETSDRSHFSQLDGLRGLLALAVFFAHSLTYHYYLTTGTFAGANSHSHFYDLLGKAGVVFFFFLTGFLFWNKAQKGNGSLGKLRIFFWHRVRRLYPAFVLPTLAYALIVIVHPGDTPAHSPAFLLHIVVNYLTFYLAPSPSLGYAGWILSMVWTLRLEWMFYLMLPLMALFARRRLSQLALLCLILALQFVLPALRSWPGISHGPAKVLFYAAGQLLYFDGFLASMFLIGMIVSFLYKHVDLGRHARSWYGSLAAVLFLVLGVTVIPFPPMALLPCVLGVPFLIIVYGNSLFGLLQTGPLRLLGMVSYSTYLIHLSVMFFLYHLMPRMATSAASPLAFWAFTALAGSVVVGLSALSYRFVEAPFMHGYGLKRVSTMESIRPVAAPQGLLDS